MQTFIYKFKLTNIDKFSFNKFSKFFHKVVTEYFFWGKFYFVFEGLKGSAKLSFKISELLSLQSTPKVCSSLCLNVLLGILRHNLENKKAKSSSKMGAFLLPDVCQ